MGKQMLVLAGRAESEKIAEALLKETIDSRSAYKKFQEFVESQGGNVEQILHPDLLPKAKYVIPVLAETEGNVQRILAQEIGIACMMLGGGRETKESTIDPAVGIILNKKIGDGVKKGDVLAYIHANDREKAITAATKIKAAYQMSTEKVARPVMI